MKGISTDPGRWIGFTNDPSEASFPCAWLRIGKRTFYVWFGFKMMKEGQ